jgi:hypothetical protein
LGHGFSVLFLTQVYGMFDKARNERIKAAISKGIDYIIKHQTSDGGWYEDYSNRATHYWLITVSQIQALRAARQTGFLVKKGSIKKAIRFVQGKDFCTCSAPCAGMDGALIVTLIAAGDYKNPTVAKHIKSLFSKISYDYRKISYPVFTHLYASQSMNFAGGERWDTYYQKTRDFLLRTQNAKGYWERMYHGHATRPPERVYATAVNCLILQMPLKSLPVFHYK